MALFSTLVSRRLVSFGKNNAVTKTKQVAFRTLASTKFLSSSNNSHQFKYSSSTKVLQRSFTTQNYDPVPKNDFFLRQFFDRESCTYSYILADSSSKIAVIVDPVIDLIDRDLEIVQELGFQIKYACNTHMHSDHMAASIQIKKILPQCKTVISLASGGHADVLVKHGETLQFGKHKLEVRATPGHTKGCVTYVCHKAQVAFTGDTLLIRGCGRTDFEQGCPETLYESIFNQIFSLPNTFRLYPGHDYRGRTVTTVLEEKKFNPRLTRSKEEFIQIMKTLNLAHMRDDGKGNLEATKNSEVGGPFMGLYKLPVN